MKFWSKLFSINSKPKLKRRYTLGGFWIELYQAHIYIEDQPSNIICRNPKGEIIWVAEAPLNGFSYFDMQVDEDANTVIGDSGTGRFYEIRLSDGKILKSKLRK